MEKKIELYSTTDLTKDKEELEKRRKMIDNLLKINELEYKITVEEEKIDESIKYILIAYVNEEDFDDVIELFDEFGYLEYSFEGKEEDNDSNNEVTNQSGNKKQENPKYSSSLILKVIKKIIKMIKRKIGIKK